MDNLFIPIDVPQIPASVKNNIISNFSSTTMWTHYDSFEHPDGPPEENFTGVDPQWDIEEISTMTSEPSDENINLKNTHKDLQDWILENLPITSIVNLYLLKTLRLTIPLHIDNTYTLSDEKHLPRPEGMIVSESFQAHKIANEPSGYRILICGNKGNGSSTGFKYRHPDTMEIHWAVIPDDTDVFLIRNYNMHHGAVKEPDETRIMAFVQGWFDETAHADLIAKSKIKFSDYIIT